MRRSAPALAAALLLAGCGANEEPAPEPSNGPASAPTLGAGELPPQVADFPVLASTDCAEVAAFYVEALASREYAQAALVWDDPVIDAARLEAVFGADRGAQVEWTEPSIEGAAGTLYCTISGKLADAADAAKPAQEGTLVLRRANDVPGATPDQLRWTLQSSTFVENLERSNRGEP
jgi:hypothetical protein